MLDAKLKNSVTPPRKVATDLCNHMVLTLPIRCFPDNCVTFICGFVTVVSDKPVGSCMLAFVLQSPDFKSDE